MEERIYHAHVCAFSFAICAAKAVVYAGNLLIAKQAELEKSDPGTWMEWLEEHLPEMHRNTAGCRDRFLCF